MLFWRFGLPAVVSSTAAYSRALDLLGHSMACTTSEQWENTLERYIDDAELRENAGKIAKHLADTEYGEDVLLNRWDALFHSIL